MRRGPAIYGGGSGPHAAPGGPLRRCGAPDGAGEAAGHAAGAGAAAALPRASSRRLGQSFLPLLELVEGAAAGPGGGMGPNAEPEPPEAVVHPVLPPGHLSGPCQRQVAHHVPPAADDDKDMAAAPPVGAGADLLKKRILYELFCNCRCRSEAPVAGAVPEGLQDRLQQQDGGLALLRRFRF